MGRKKSLAEELADLVTPGAKKEEDPEAYEFGNAGAVLDESEDEDEQQVQKPVRKAPERKFRLRGDIDMEDEAYRGKKSSRAKMFGKEDDGSAGLFQGIGGDDEEPDEGDGGEQDEGDGGSSDDADAEEGEEDEEGAGGGGESGSGGEEGAEAWEQGAQPSALEAEYAELEAEEQAAVASMKERRAREHAKGLAVRAQRGLWERSLELRLLVQRALAGANRMPQAEAHASVVASGAEMRGAYRALAKGAAATLESLLELQAAVAAQNEAVAKARDEVPPPPPLLPGEEGSGASAALWRRIEEQGCAMRPYVDISVDRWHRKTVLASGASAKGGLKMLGQGVSAQVEQLTRDKARALKRARLPLAGGHRVLCQGAPAGGGGEGGDGDPGAGGEDEGDPETYDDGEFYQTLLREFLETGALGGAGAAAARGPKRRKVVDRRASKGRKLRYHVHEPLANFMAPVDREVPAMAGQLFATIFGGTHVAC